MMSYTSYVGLFESDKCWVKILIELAKRFLGEKSWSNDTTVKKRDASGIFLVIDNLLH